LKSETTSQGNPRRSVEDIIRRETSRPDGTVILDLGKCNETYYSDIDTASRTDDQLGYRYFVVVSLTQSTEPFE